MRSFRGVLNSGSEWRVRVNNSVAVRNAVAQGLGIGQLLLAVVAQAPAGGKLARVLPEWQPPKVPVHAVFPGLRYLTPKVRAFIDHAAEAFESIGD